LTDSIAHTVHSHPEVYDVTLTCYSYLRDYLNV